MGAKDYSFGNHPVWELGRTLYQMTLPPLVIGGFALGAGYFWSMVQRKQVSVSRELVSFTRREQMLRLRRLATRSRAAHPVARASAQSAAPRSG